MPIIYRLTYYYIILSLANQAMDKYIQLHVLVCDVLDNVLATK